MFTISYTKIRVTLLGEVCLFYWQCMEETNHEKFVYLSPLCGMEDKNQNPPYKVHNYRAKQQH